MNRCEGKPMICIAETLKWGVTSELFFVIVVWIRF
jgi:hypothetical protein